MTRITADVALGAIAIFLCWCAAQALAPEPPVDAGLDAPQYVVDPPIVATAAGASLAGPSVPTVIPTSPTAAVVQTPVTVAEPARRLAARQITDTVPPPTTVARSVEQIIRDVWPDHLEERALTIAWRESRFKAAARNACCHGVFQIHWTVHRGWLDDYGVTSVEQLYDPAINVRMALVLFQRAGGWGPWSQTNY